MAELNVEESGNTRWKGAMPVETLLFLNGFIFGHLQKVKISLL